MRARTIASTELRSDFCGAAERNGAKAAFEGGAENGNIMECEGENDEMSGEGAGVWGCKSENVEAVIKEAAGDGMERVALLSVVEMEKEWNGMKKEAGDFMKSDLC